jgi:hypothetical protein
MKQGQASADCADTVLRRRGVPLTCAAECVAITPRLQMAALRGV